MDDPNERIGANIRRLREASGMTQAGMAEALAKRGIDGMHPQTITKIESGQRAVKFLEALAIAEIVGVQPQALRALTKAHVDAWHFQQALDEALWQMQDVEELAYQFEVSRQDLGYKLDGEDETPENRVVRKMARGVVEQTLEDIVSRARARIAAEESADEGRFTRGAVLSVYDLFPDLVSQEGSEASEEVRDAGHSVKTRSAKSGRFVKSNEAGRTPGKRVKSGQHPEAT